MKMLNQLLFVAVIGASFSLAGTATAQYKPTGDDGISASPRVRQQLNERSASMRASALAPVVAVAPRTPALEGVTASPKVRQMLAESKRVVSGAASFEVATVGYQATGSDGITASPRLRQQLDERHATFMVAPVK